MSPFPSLIAIVGVLSVLPCALTKTVKTGDILDGYSVITNLDISDVPSSAVTRYYLRVGELNGGFPLHLPVFVARGTKETLESGPRLSVSGTIHGDELNPVRVVQKVFEELEGNVERLNGTVIGVPTINPLGILLNNRNTWSSANSGSLINMNRIFPGQNATSGGNEPNVIAYTLWNISGETPPRSMWQLTFVSAAYGLTIYNMGTDCILDTPSSGSDSSLWCYADFRVPYVQRMAHLLEPNVLKIDPGEPGSIETTFNEYNVSAITVEIGIAKTWLPDLIKRTVEYVGRVMVDRNMLPTNPFTNSTSGYSNSTGPYVPDLSNTYIGTTFLSLPAEQGGFVEKFITFDKDVKEGQLLAYVRNVWGDIVQKVTAPPDARVHQTPIDPSVEPGQQILQLVYNSTDPGCADGCIF